PASPSAHAATPATKPHDPPTPPASAILAPSPSPSSSSPLFLCEPLSPRLSGTDTPVCAFGFSSSRLRPNELEGAPPLVFKGGLLRSNATNFLLFFSVNSASSVLCA